MKAIDFEGEILQFAGSRPKASREGFTAPIWPDDCPDCERRMEFVFAPVVARVCVCGRRVTVRDLIGPSKLPVKPRRKVRR